MAVRNEVAFAIETFDVVGIVVRNLPRDEGVGARCDVIPLYINPGYACEPSGGLFILEHDDIDNFYYSVVWCDWPEREDHKRLEPVRAHVYREAELEHARRNRS